MLAIAAGLVPQGAPGNEPAVMAGASSFYDEFDSLSRNRWFVSDGWSNGPHQGCTWSSSNVKLANGTMGLVLNNRQTATRKFSCAELQTRALYGYGTYEARLRPAAGPGIVSAFFSYSSPAQGAKTTPERWMSFEFTGKDSKMVQLNLFTAGGPVHRHTVTLPFEPSESLNDYAIQWAPQSVRWFVNRQLVHTVDTTPAERAADAPAKIFVSLRNGNGPDQVAWLGEFAYDGQPLLTTYQYIAFTKLGTPCLFPTSVVCKQANP